MQLTWLRSGGSECIKAAQGEADTTSKVLNLLAFGFVCLGHINHT